MLRSFQTTILALLIAVAFAVPANCRPGVLYTDLGISGNTVNGGVLAYIQYGTTSASTVLLRNGSAVDSDSGSVTNSGGTVSLSVGYGPTESGDLYELNTSAEFIEEDYQEFTGDSKSLYSELHIPGGPSSLPAGIGNSLDIATNKLALGGLAA